MMLRMPRCRRMERMLTLYRRHASSCKHHKAGAAHLKCDCPLWAWGSLPNGQWVRKALSTRSMAEARRTVERWERDQRVGAPPSVGFAVEAFLSQSDGLATSTRRKRAKIMRYFCQHCESWKAARTDQITVETIDHYRAKRPIAPRTWQKELETLRAFCGFCVDRDWMTRNVAKKVKPPSDIKPAEREPYTESEMVAILAACDEFGQKSYERLRARAMVLMMRHTALSIRDAFLLRRGAVRNGFLDVRREKTGKQIRLPVTVELQAALERLPLPQGAGPGCPYFFYNGRSDVECAMRCPERTLRAVFKRSGVANAKSHRFRHTLATRMLEQGASFEDVAVVLGNSARIVEKYYAKWSRGREERIHRIFRAAHGMENPTRVTQ